jgi:hypothetical protein
MADSADTLEPSGNLSLSVGDEWVVLSLDDEYVHIEVEPPEEPLPDSDAKRQQHLKQLRQQVADELHSKLLDVDARLAALRSGMPSPLQADQEKGLREESDAIIGQLQETFEGRQILELPAIQKRVLQPDLSALDQHQRTLMEQQRKLDALMAQVSFEYASIFEFGVWCSGV